MPTPGRAARPAGRGVARRRPPCVLRAARCSRSSRSPRRTTAAWQGCHCFEPGSAASRPAPIRSRPGSPNPCAAPACRRRRMAGSRRAGWIGRRGGRSPCRCRHRRGCDRSEARAACRAAPRSREGSVRGRAPVPGWPTCRANSPPRIGASRRPTTLDAPRRSSSHSRDRKRAPTRGGFASAGLLLLPLDVRQPLIGLAARFLVCPRACEPGSGLLGSV